MPLQRCHFLQKGSTNDGSANIDARTEIVADVTHVYIRRHVTAGDLVVVVGSLFPRFHSPFPREGHPSFLSESFQYIHTCARSGKGRESRRLRREGDEKREGVGEGGVGGNTPSQESHTTVRVARTMGPFYYRVELSSPSSPLFSPSAHSPCAKLLRRRVAIIFSPVSPVISGPLIYVVLHLTVPR